MANYYADQLRQLNENPGSYSGSPGFQFALDTGLQGAQRQMSGNRGSGGALAALTKYGTGLAQQDYGNQFNRLLSAAGQTDQTNLATDRLGLDRELGTGRLALDRELGTGALGVSRDRLAMDDRLGTGALGVSRDRLAMDDRLGMGRLDNERRGQDQNFGLGTFQSQNAYDLGMAGNNTNRERNWWDYSLGRDRQAGQNADAANTNSLNWYNAQTQRGTAQSNDFLGRDSQRRGWQPYGATGNLTGYEDRRPAWAR